MVSEANKLVAFVEAMEAAEKADNNYAAIALALTIPDICASIDKPGRGRSRERYVEWWDQFVIPYFDELLPPDEDGWTFLPGIDVWALRNAYLHAGQDRLDEEPAPPRRVVFLHSRPGGLADLSDDGLRYVPVDYFVQAVSIGTRRWLSARQHDRSAIVRLNDLLSIAGPDEFYDSFIDRYGE